MAFSWCLEAIYPNLTPYGDLNHLSPRITLSPHKMQLPRGVCVCICIILVVIADYSHTGNLQLPLLCNLEYLMSTVLHCSANHCNGGCCTLKINLSDWCSSVVYVRLFAGFCYTAIKNYRTGLYFSVCDSKDYLVSWWGSRRGSTSEQFRQLLPLAGNCC